MKNETNIYPFLWFNGNAEEAASFYVSIFKNSSILRTLKNGKSGPGPEGSVLTVEFELDGQRFVGLNGGPDFKFSEAISFCVNCVTQKEIDEKWEKLSAGGEEQPCGWLKDKFGLSWQIVPPLLTEYLLDKDAQKAQRVMQAMMKMKKINIQSLEDAYEGR